MTTMNLCGDAVLHEVRQQRTVVIGQRVLDHSQDVDGRVGEELEPVLTPVGCNVDTVYVT